MGKTYCANIAATARPYRSKRIALGLALAAVSLGSTAFTATLAANEDLPDFGNDFTEGEGGGKWRSLWLGGGVAVSLFSGLSSRAVFQRADAGAALGEVAARHAGDPGIDDEVAHKRCSEALAVWNASQSDAIKILEKAVEQDAKSEKSKLKLEQGALIEQQSAFIDMLVPGAKEDEDEEEAKEEPKSPPKKK